MNKSVSDAIESVIKDYKEHYDFPWQGESHMRDCLADFCGKYANEIDQLKVALEDAIGTLRMLDNHHHVDVGAIRKALDRDFVASEVRRVLG